jgi:hypothetical protein
MTSPRLRLSDLPDGLGFYYGTFTANGETYRIDATQPGMKVTALGAVTVKDGVPWDVYCDGEPIGQADSRDSVVQVVERHLGLTV